MFVIFRVHVGETEMFVPGPWRNVRDIDPVPWRNVRDNFMAVSLVILW